MDEAFSNRQVADSELPDFRKVRMTPVAPGYLTWALVSQTLFWLVMVLAALIVQWLPFAADRSLWWLPLPPLSLAVMGAIYAVFDARHRAWALREHDLVYRYGVIWRKTVIVPFARIQHVEAISGPLERKLDLMRVKCFTAGGMSADLTVKGLDRSSARRVRQYLLEQIAAAADSDDETSIQRESDDDD
jgi:hypothetical protein